MAEDQERSSIPPTPVTSQGNGESAQRPVADESPGTNTSPLETIGTLRRPPRLRLGLILALVGLCAVLGAEAVFIVKGSTSRQAPAPSSSAVVQTTAAIPDPDAGDIALSRVAPNPSLVTGAESSTAPAPAFDEEGVDEEPKRAKPKHYSTVQEAAVGSCTTSSVDGLSRQIIEQVRCSDPNAFAPIPSRPNLVIEPHIFPYLEATARDHLLKVLDKNRDKTLTIHSALRTVAQQYLVWRWAGARRCGVQMATAPGESNHETGRALDIANQAQWRNALEAQDFRWLGSSDVVHFDFKTNRSVGRAPDILAFQKLWNRNHPDDRILESGTYDANTEQRLRKSPPGGFKLGPTCTKSRLTRVEKPKRRR
jgi:hypothetical protein